MIHFQTQKGKRSQNTEDYVNFVGDVMYPKKIYGPYGFHADKLRVTTIIDDFFAFLQLLEQAFLLHNHDFLISHH